MNEFEAACRRQAMGFLAAAASAEKLRSPTVQYYREKAAMWFRRAARAGR